jgi:predicted Zn-dependent protease
MIKIVSTCALLTTGMILLSGCATITKIGTTVAVLTGQMSQQAADATVKTVEAAEKALEKITPENEYYIGRSAAAMTLEKNKPLNNKKSAHYLNVLGQTLAQVSDKPDTYNGYHFIIMDSAEVNAFAAPGGLILVTKGLLKCCKDEDSLAAVLAHEIAHIQHDDALKAISKGRWTSLFTVAGTSIAKVYGPAELAQITECFEGTLDDIMKTVFVNGYKKDQEYAADAAAVAILQRVGYNPHAMKQMLLEVDKTTDPSATSGFGKTHPSPKDRLTRLDAVLKDIPPVDPPPARKARFDKAMAGI